MKPSNCYWSESPCLRGHIGYRRVSNYTCIECAKIHLRTHTKKVKKAQGPKKPNITDHPLYGTWNAMKKRCYVKSAGNYYKYGALGVTVCGRWLYGENGIHAFLCFVADMGDKPTEQHSIDRKDPTGNYTPDNCRWATSSEQNKNKRPTVVTTK